MFILKKGQQPGVYVPLRALFLVCVVSSMHSVRFALSFKCIISTIKPQVHILG